MNMAGRVDLAVTGFALRLARWAFDPDRGAPVGVSVLLAATVAAVCLRFWR